MYQCSRHHQPLMHDVAAALHWCPVCEYEEAMGIPVDQPVSVGTPLVHGSVPPTIGGKDWVITTSPREDDL